MSKQKHDRQWYLKQVRKCIEQITLTPKDNVARFELLKKKAKKYLEEAKKHG